MAISLHQPRLRAVDGNGVPVSGAKLYVYEAGTTTKRAIYSDASLSVAAANPLTADAEGWFALTYTASGTYKLRMERASGALIEEADNLDTGVPVGGGALAVAAGGTGATTAAGARTNLSVPSASEMATAQTDIATLQTRLGTTGATTLASGTDAQEPAAATAGRIRWNSDDGNLTVDTGSAWKAIPHAGKIDNTYYAPGSGVYVLQSAKTYLASETSISATTPALDGTPPQVTEGTQVFNVSITPKLATTKIRVRLFMPMYSASSPYVSAAAYRNGGASCIDAVQSYVVGSVTLMWEFEDLPATTAATAYSIRVGVSTGSVTIGRTTSVFGSGLNRAFIVVDEVYTP